MNEIIEQLKILKDMIVDGEKLQLQCKKKRQFIVEHNINLLDGIETIKETVQIYAGSSHD